MARHITLLDMQLMQNTEVVVVSLTDRPLDISTRSATAYHVSCAKALFDDEPLERNEALLLFASLPNSVQREFPECDWCKQTL